MTKQISGLTEETTTAPDDFVVVRDTSAGADRKVQLQNLAPSSGVAPKNPYTFSANATATTGLVNSTEYEMVWGTENFDPSSMFASNTLTAPFDCKVMIIGMVYANYPNCNEVRLLYKVNSGTSQFMAWSEGSGFLIASGSKILSLSSGDTVKLVARMASSSGTGQYAADSFFEAVILNKD